MGSGAGPALAFLVVGLASAMPVGASSVDALEALNQGNRLFRNGQIEEAVEAYRRGYSPATPHPTLAYNLGTALHHADRLPEAILWYRRAEGSEDPWLQENLWLARRTLGSQVLKPPGLSGTLARRGDVLRAAAIILAWAGLVLLFAGRRLPPAVFISIGAVALALYGTALGVERWGPRPAVLLQDCRAARVELPAGTEVWVRPNAGNWAIASGAQGTECPAEVLELVFPG